MTDPQPQPAPESREVPRLTAVLLAVAALAWMAGMLLSARAKITGWADAEMEVTSTALALPGVVSAAVAAGAAVALLALTLISGRRVLGATARFAVGTGAGLLVGVLGTIPIVTINTEGTIYAVVGGTMAAAATIGGALAGLRIPPVIAASGWATLGVFLIGVALNNEYVQDPVLNLLGDDTTAAAANANQNFSYGQSALSGITAGLIAFAVLRRARKRNSGVDLRWPFYLMAGAGPGILSVIAEVLTRTAGSQVLDLAGKVSELEKTVQQILSTNRLNSALIVLFVGAFTAMVAVGRTLSPAADEDDAEVGVQAQASTAEAVDAAEAFDKPDTVDAAKAFGTPQAVDTAEAFGTPQAVDTAEAFGRPQALDTVADDDAKVDSADAGEPATGGKPAGITSAGDRK
jgi:hypothetical protein